MPAGFAVVSLDLREALDDGFFANHFRALVFLEKPGAERTLAEFSGHSNGAHGLQFFQAAMGLNIFGDDFIHGLGGRTRRTEHRGEQSEEQRRKKGRFLRT